MPAFQGGNSAVAAALVLAALAFLLAAVALAGVERYDYDPLGRLIRTVDSSGQVTEYVYDAAGNILEVRRAGSAQQLAPTVQSSAPDALRRGESVAVHVAGTNFTGARLSVPNAGLSATQVRIAVGTLDFQLSASLDAPLGSQTFSVVSSTGSASFAVRVDPVLPTLQVSPVPLAVAPDGIDRAFALTLSNADGISHTLNLAVSDPAVAGVSPASLTIAAGATQAQATVRGLSAGNATLAITSPTLAAVSTPLYVTADFRGINTSYARTVGVVLQQPAQPSVRSVDPLLGANLGVLRPPFIQALLPNVLIVGTGPTELVVAGGGLESATGLSIVPAEGLTLGSVTVDANGTAVRVPITVAANAPTVMRQVVLAGPSAPYRAATAEADRLLITLPPPEVTSVEPIVAAPGTSGLTFFVRGRNLQGAQASFSPSTGIAVGASPQVSADGTQLTLALDVALNAPLGDRVVTVTTPGGTSSIAASPSNTFSVVNQLVGTVTPVSAAPLGVTLQADSIPAPQPLSLPSPNVGVALGSVILGVSPAAGVIGSGVDVVLSGNGLAGVTAVQFASGEGLTVAAPVPAADGQSVSVHVDIASSAPQTLRGIRVLAGATVIPFSQAGSAVFLVSAPRPRVDSISPIYLEVGAPAVTLSVRGANFQSASQVRVTPSTGVAVSTPPQVSADGTQALVNISAVSGTATGARVVTVVTPGGESAADATPATILTLVSSAGPSIAPIAAPLVRAIVQTAPEPTQIALGPIGAPLLGIELQQAPASTPSSLFLANPTVSVAYGAAAIRVQVPALVPGAAGTLTISGFNLLSVNSVTLNPPDGISLGAPQVSLDGTQVSLTFAVAANAPSGPREVVVSAGGVRVAFFGAAASRLYVATGAPSIDSLTPILAAQGSVVTLTVRGQNLQAASAVAAQPGDGLAFEPAPSVDSGGTQLVIRFTIAPSAPIGPRVIQVLTPGGISSGNAAPANTFTVTSP